MTAAGIFTLLVTAGMFFFLLFERFPPVTVVFLAVVTLLAGGVLSAKEVLEGFSNEGVGTIAALSILVASFEKNRWNERFALWLFGKEKTQRGALTRMMGMTSAVSAFFNNTPIVLMLTPIVKNWAVKAGFSPSKFLLPLSYAAIFGGMCTLIGTSTNIVVNAYLKQKGLEGFSMFEFAFIGVPCTIVGIIYMVTFGVKWLPGHQAEGGQKHAVTEIVTKNELSWKNTIPIFVLIFIIGAAVFNWLPLITVSFLGVAVLFLTKNMSAAEAKEAIDWNLLVLIGSSFGIAKALENSGLAVFAGDWLVRFVNGASPYIALAVVYGITMLVTEMITNNAAAAIVLPLAFSLVEKLQLNPEPFAMAIAIAASAGFATPIGYQTNLIVYGPGNYRFTDFLKVGPPLNLLFLIIAVFGIPLFWKF
ncbi:SLC13 family permease [Bacillota bacterium Lsc_1132]